MSTLRPIHLPLLLTTLVAAPLAGCGGEAMNLPGEPDAERRPFEGPRCPDPTTDCTNSNGDGVYYEIDGMAVINDGDYQFFISHFINPGISLIPGAGTVKVGGRWNYIPNTLGWQAFPSSSGVVTSATYNNVAGYSVRSITESGTALTVKLADANGHITNVSGGNIGLVSLYLQISYPSGPVRTYVLSLSPVSGGGAVSKYEARYRISTPQGLGPSTIYCRDHNEVSDPVVFQHGIWVNPQNGRVTRDATTDPSYVTMSCSLGAPAVCKTWGYEWLGANASFFDGCIQMKRASYCADGRAWTSPGTPILIKDSIPVSSDAVTDTNVEANWTGNGATCFHYARHPDLGFNGFCNGVQLPLCNVAQTVATPGAAYQFSARDPSGQ